MSTNKIFIFAAFFLLSACNQEWFIHHTGNMPAVDRVEKVKLGQNEGEVRSILGSPSSVVSLDKDTWIYMSSDVKKMAFFKPEEISRDVLTIKFEEGKVVDIKRMALKDGKEVAIAEEKTETYGHTPGFFEKYFGGVGQYSPIGAPMETR